MVSFGSCLDSFFFRVYGRGDRVAEWTARDDPCHRAEQGTREGVQGNRYVGKTQSIFF